jgi:phosphoribosyl-ATP pyrophosphohydrolase
MLVPGIDVLGGQPVKAVSGGGFEPIEGTDLMDLAARLSRVGEITLVDLDAALGLGDNEALLRRVVRRYPCRVGGGIRDEDKARRLLRAGARKVVIGTAASREFLSRLPRARVLVAVDALEGDVVTDGWTRHTGRTPLEVMQIVAPYCSGFSCTFVEGEGSMAGLPLDRVRELQSATNLPLTVSGGVRSALEVRELDRMGVDVESGTALRTGRFTAAEAFVACMDFGPGGITTVVTDKAGQILRLEQSTAESLRLSLETGRASFACSDGGLPAEHGDGVHGTRVIRALAACRRDAAVLVVEPDGNACARGIYSCFGSGGRDFGLQRLHEIISTRRGDPRPGSYTSFLFEKEDRIPRKLTEEMYELLTARNRDDIAWEAADVIYFLMAYLVKHDVGLDEVVAELAGRER